MNTDYIATVTRSQLCLCPSRGLRCVAMGQHLRCPDKHCRAITVPPLKKPFNTLNCEKPWAILSIETKRHTDERISSSSNILQCVCVCVCVCLCVDMIVQPSKRTNSPDESPGLLRAPLAPTGADGCGEGRGRALRLPSPSGRSISGLRFSLSPEPLMDGQAGAGGVILYTLTG